MLTAPLDRENWRANPDVTTLGGISSPTASDVPEHDLEDGTHDTRSRLTTSDMMVRCVMIGLALVDWLKGQWMLWSMLLSIWLAYAFPSSLGLNNALTQALVAVTFAFTGAALPEMRGSGIAFKYAGATVLVVTFSLIISPLVASVAFIVSPRSHKNDSAQLLTGLLCTFCLPPSTVLSVIATKSAQGNEVLSHYLGSVGNVVGVLVGPLLMSLVIKLLEAGKAPPTRRLLLFPAIALVPFAIGFAAQRVFCYVSHRSIMNDQAKRRAGTTQLTFAEMCDISVKNWRSRAGHLNFAAVLLLNYIIFSSFFENTPSATPTLTWHGVGDVIVMVVVVHLTLCVVGWASSSIVLDTAEDRIALFHALVHKSEVLAVPILSFMFRDQPEIALLLVAPMVYHLMQTAVSGLLSIPLRKWRNHFNCKPGTTMLPLRLAKSQRPTPPL